MDGDVTKINNPNKTSKTDIMIVNYGELSPIDDITPLESVKLSMMMVCALRNSLFDPIAFIKENGLERHFTK